MARVSSRRSNLGNGGRHEEQISTAIFIRYVNFEDEIYFKGGRNVTSTIFMLTDMYVNLITREWKGEI